MATTEKLLKAFESLKAFQQGNVTGEEAASSSQTAPVGQMSNLLTTTSPAEFTEVARDIVASLATGKKELAVGKKDRVAHLVTIADAMCASNFRTMAEFPKFLGISMEMFLSSCDDKESDVRMVADECLNRTVKMLLETNLGRLQVELYKEIKKNGAARSLRAALWRFAELSHLIRPQKCRPYVVNLLPCFNRICRRQEDSVQETLANSLKKTFPVLGSFTNDAEIKVLLKTFLPNLRSASAVTRRTAASCLVVFCQYSRKPCHFFCWLLTVLLGMVIPIQEDRKNHTLLGVLLCLRHLVPHLATLHDLEDDSLKGSFGVTKKDPELSINTEQLVQVFELVLYYSQHTDHNVVTASLETFQQLLRTPPPGLLPVLTRPGSITQSAIFKEGGQQRVGSSSQLSGVGEEDSGMEDDRSEVSSTATDDLPPIVKLNLDPSMQPMNLEQSAAAADLETLDSSTTESSGIGLLQTGGDGGIFNALEKVESLPGTPTTIEFPGSVQNFPEHAAADDVIVNPNGGSYSNVEIGSVTVEDDFPSESEVSPVGIVSEFIKTHHRTDSNMSTGSQDAERPVVEEVTLPEEGSEVAASAERMTGDVGHYTDEEVPLIHCTRLLCSSFLLTGHEKGLVRDREVRVSVKALSLGCLGAIFNLHPRAFSIKLYRPSQDNQGPESRQLVRDILLFSNHGDPQLKGNTAVLVGNFIHSALTEARLKYDLWIQAICEEQGTPLLLLESLVSCLQTCLTDQASVTCRMTCVALKTCLVTLLQSSSGDLGLRLVLATLGQRDTSYWLGKVELLELLSQVDFKLVKYLEESFPFMRKGDHSYLGAMNCQQRLLEDIVLHLIGDDDYRVRHAATAALVRLVPRLFYPVDHPQHDPVVASAKGYSSAHLDQEAQQQAEEPYRPPPCTMWGYETSGLVSASLESSLSRVVSAIMRRLNSSTSKSLTFGCLHALCQLSREFPVCQYTTAWCCVGITTFTPKDSSGRANLPRPGSRSRSLNGSLTSSMTSSLTSSITSTSSISSVSSQLSMEESITGSGGGPLPMVLSLLLSSWLPLDLAAHQDALLLAGNLLAGAASRSLKAPYDEEKPSGKEGVKEGVKEEEDGWHALQDRNLVPLAQQLLSHLARVVNVCSHVIEQVVPGPPAKTALPSLPNAPSLSPIKRKPKGKDGVDQGSATASPSKGSAKKGSDAGLPTEKEPDRPNKSNIGTFWQLPGYMKLYSVLKGAYSNYKVSLDPSATEKFTGLLKTVLDVLSQVLEIATFIDISKYVEELLSYLKSTVAMEPASTIQCVEQLLKALFGTNLASQWDGSQTAETSRKPGKATRLSSNMKPGLYHYCFTAPYTQFTQSLAAASFRNSQAEGEEGGGILSWFKHRSSDKKVSPAIAKLVKGDKTPIHNYIRLFEPLVIKSLKLYTVTSSVNLQRQVLHLLAQLVQLRVNYCLLDSDQIFIGFVIKQFEYIEAGQIRGSETLIPPIFHFLVLLSYERYHSKSIIVMPRIIQLCDGVMASGQKATNHAIPALQPIVHDLFVLRGNSKADQGKELDTQREVVVSMLVRLIHYPEVLEMLTIVLQQCHKESEDRWKKLSRQVIDMVLPMLARQQICLSTPSALNTLHGLFESVTPSSLRPLDMLLKTLFSPPTDLTSPDGFLRWSSMVLSVLRVLISQSKEEVIMARLQELGLSANIFTNNVIYRAKGRAVDLDGDAPFEEVPEEALARFLLQVIGALAEEIAFRSNTSVLQREGCHSLAQQLAHLLLYVTYILKSGLFRKVLSAAMALPEESPTEAYYSVEQLNLFFQDMVPSHPTLVLQWCQILLLLNFNELSWWSEIMQTPKRSMKASSSSGNTGGGGGGGKKGKARTPDEVANRSAICCSEEVVRRGGLILFCDYVTPVFTPLIPATATLYGELVLEKKCQNLSDVEHMTWVIINHVKDLIELAQEPPVQDFISAIHRNSAASGLFLQAIHSRCEKLSKPCIVKSMLGCLEGIHLTQSGTLLTLLIDKFLQTPHHALARMCDSLACRRVEMILAQPVEDSRTQFPVEDVEKLQVFMRESGLALRHQRLASLLARFKAVITQQAVPPVEPAPSSHPLDAANINIASLSINKDLYVATVQDHCFRRDSNAQECALMLSKLDYSDVLTIMMTKEFHMRLLEDSISVGLQQSLVSSAHADVLNRTKGLKLGKAHHLLRASCITLLRHVSNVVNILPSPQQLVSPGNHHPGNHTSRSRTPPREKYRLKMEMLLADREWRHSVFHMAAGLTVYLLSLNKIPEQCQIPEDSFTDICRFSILVLEILCYLLYKGRTPSSQQLQTAVECCCSVLKNPQLFAIFVAQEHAHLVTTAVGSIHQVVKSVCISAGEKLSPVNLPETGEGKNVSEDQQRALLACRQMCELLQCLTTTLSPGNTRLPQFLSAPLRNVVLNLARLPMVNSYARTPPIVWKMGWGASPGGETGTKLPELPFDFLQEREVLKDFIYRINAVGWTSRTQFEETWAGLLGILSALPITVPAESREEEIEKTQANVLAVRTITALVLDSTLHPQPGNPASSVYEYRPRSKPPSYINTRSGRKLAQVRHIVEKEIMAIAAERCDLCSHHPYFNMHEQQLLEGEGGLYSADAHRTLGFTDYGLGHVSIKSIWSDNHILNQTPDTDEEPDFPDPEDGMSQPMVTTPRRFRGGLDIHSCLQFLVELYSQWMEPTAMPRTPVPLLCEVAKSILLISDLFTELRQYEWMFDSLLELNKIHPVEDEILLQYVVPGVCKAGAVMGMEGPVAERVSKLLESSLKSTHLPTKVGSVYGSLYILEAGPSEASKLLVPVLQDYLSKNIPPTAQCCIVHVEPHVLAMWATAFYLLEHYQEDLKESDFKSVMLQAAITTASGSEEVTPAPVYHAVVRGLERLLVTRVLTGHEAEPLVKLSVDRLCLPSPPRAIAALGLMLTCMYTGKDGGDLGSDTGSGQSEPTTPDNESLIVAMERVTVLFDRIRKGFPCEARVVARILPTFLDDFFPAQDIMNKVIGEFLSSQQPHPQLMAKVLYDVFHNLHERDQQQVVRDWVMLSLSNFTQRTPVAMATWSLTCFFLSASTNPWVCALLPHVVGRMGLMETVDRKLFCITALDFYKNQITEELDRRAFESIFQAASSSAPDGPYLQLIQLIH
ncbi:huntingtin-like isoform X2 [Branchiostoma lanceolatum]|uniref:huntingtin-like isoform X2 n=1 Tax=Branchiostoma lanceolatum TaxID=7740 RepID=UPI003456169A